MDKHFYDTLDLANAALKPGQAVYRLSVRGHDVFQVVNITYCPSGMPPRVPHPVADKHKVSAKRPVKAADPRDIYGFEVLDETEAYLFVSQGGAPGVWIGKRKIHSIVRDGGTVSLELDVPYATKRGFAA